MFRLVKLLWGDISKKELKKFTILSLALLFIVGTYWIVRPIKDALFLTFVGKALLPYAKIVSLITLVILLMLYAKLVDLLDKYHLFYFLNLITGSFFFGLAIIIFMTSGLSTQFPHRSMLIGWIAFIGSECLLVLQFSMFWSFVASSVDTQEAKKGYPIIIAGAQIGGIAGPLLTTNVISIGIVTLLFIAGLLIFGITIIIKFFTLTYPHAFNNVTKNKKKQTGAIEGLRLLLRHPYLMGILLISILPDVIGEILNISMLFFAEISFRSPEKLVGFLGLYGVLVNTASFIFAFFGTSFFLRRWGLAAGLLFSPIVTAVIIIYTWTFYSLWSIVIAMIILKGLEHSLVQATREIMFIPTSKDIMFKAKSWTSVFGARIARGTGAGLIVLFVSTGSLAFYAAIASLGLVGLWFPVAKYVGRENIKLVNSGKILE